MSDRGFTDGMRDGLLPPSRDDETTRPTFGDLLKVMEIPGILTDEEMLWYRDQIRHMLGLPDYPRTELVDPDTPLSDYDPEDYA